MAEEFELNLSAYDSETKLGTAALIATLIVVAIAACWVFLNPKRDIKVAIQQADVFALSAPGTADNGLYVVATLRIVDEMRHPIFLDGNSASLTTADGTIIDGIVVGPHDLPALQAEIPSIAPLVNRAEIPQVHLRDAVAPESGLNTFVVLRFPGQSKLDWQTKKSATFTLQIVGHKPCTIPFVISPKQPASTKNAFLHGPF